MNIQTDDLRIRDIRELITPEDLTREFPCSEHAAIRSASARAAMHRILHGKDDRLVVVVGPCSIHDTEAALEYARAPRPSSASGSRDDLEIVMRVYFEKPRTTVGWKGLINDPHLDGSFASTRGCAWRASCCSISPRWACPPAASSST